MWYEDTMWCVMLQYDTWITDNIQKEKEYLNV